MKDGLTKHALVIGYGSIGSRHARVLTELGRDVSLVTSQTVENYLSYTSIEKALSNHFVEQIIIANSTHLHYETLKKILAFDFKGTILVEKPLFSRVEQLESDNKNIYISYNLRFHALIQELKILLQKDELVSFSAQVGSYLPEWRKKTDYRNCYSAKKECGGGVLRDLSHELDYILWLCGQCVEVTAMGGHYSILEINSDDVYSILMRCEHCPIVNLQLDYLSRTPTRKITIHTKKHNTISVDLIQGDLYLNGNLKLHIQDAVNKSYMTQHKLMLQKDFQHFCDYEQGLAVMHLIEAIEIASLEKKWITL